jgi:hypothetical protein
LELDLQAQHTRLQTLQDELARLRELKSRLETARAQGDQELAAWVLEDQQFQNLVAQVSPEFQHIPTIHLVGSHHRLKLGDTANMNRLFLCSKIFGDYQSQC